MVGPSWVGDLIQSQVLFAFLHSRNPETPVDCILPPWTYPLASRIPGIDRAYELDVAHGQFGLGPRWRLARELRAQGYGQAIIIPRSWKAALIPFWAGIPHRTGFLGEMRYTLLNDIRPNPPRYQIPFRRQLISLALPADEPLSSPIPDPSIHVDPEARSRTLNRLGVELHSGQSVVALLPGAEYGPAKRWPLDSFTELAQILQQWGHRVWILGSARDHGLGSAISSETPGAVNLCGQTTLPEAADLLSLVSLAVTNDSGLMHLAAGVGARLVCLYGSSSAEYTPPGSPQAILLSLHLDCSPCFARECPLGHLNCLRQLSVTQVAEAVREQLSRHAST